MTEATHTELLSIETRRKLDQRIRNQRLALRENWQIVEMRQRSQRRIASSLIKQAGELCDLLGVPRTPDDCPLATIGIHHRIHLAKQHLLSNQEKGK